jgi:ATP-dependent RNA helicase DDX21
MIVELVVQSKPPTKRFGGKEDTETYVHRSGRTGRAGRKGICVTLVGPRDKQALIAIEWSIGNSFEWLGAPNPQTLVRTAAQTAATEAACIGPEVTSYFEEAAASLLADKGGDVNAALAAALALATGTTKPPANRSLITHQDGYATFHATFKTVVQSTGFVWSALRKLLPEGACDGAQG